MILLEKDEGTKKNYYMVLLDRWCRNTVKASISGTLRKQVIFISDFSEITDEVLEKTRTLFILETFMNDCKAVAYMRLYGKLKSLDLVYLGADSSLYGSVRGICRIYPCDVTSLSIELLVSAAYNDSSMKAEPCKGQYYGDSRDLAISLSKGDSSMQIRKLANDFLLLEEERHHFQEEKNVLTQELEKEKQDKLVLLSRNTKLEEGYRRILQDSYRLNRTLRDYEGILSKELYKKINLGEYAEKPLILYFKEFEELLGFDTFVSTLYEVFRMQNRNSVKVLMLFDSYTARRMNVLPDYFVKLYNSYNSRQVIMNDFIAKAGDPTGVLDQILCNKEGLNVLLIFDCKSLPSTVLIGQYLQFNICRNSRHLAAYGLVEENTVVNGNTGACYLEYDSDRYNAELPALSGQTEKFIYLSSQKIYQNILELTKLYKSRLEV